MRLGRVERETTTHLRASEMIARFLEELHFRFESLLGPSQRVAVDRFVWAPDVK